MVIHCRYDQLHTFCADANKLRHSKFINCASYSPDQLIINVLCSYDIIMVKSNKKLLSGVAMMLANNVINMQSITIKMSTIRYRVYTVV